MRSMVYRLTAIAVVVVASPAFAQAPILLNYQARLSDNAGNPVPDGNYQITFAIFEDSTGGTPVWSETYPAVHTSNGFFDVNLGSTEPFDDGRTLLDIPTPYLQIQVGTAGPLTPRTRITSVAHSAIAQRINGDIKTSDSTVVLGTAQKSISLNNGSETMGLVIEERPTDPVSGRRLFAGVDSGEVALGFEGPNGQRLFDVSGMPGSLGNISWRIFNPQPEPPGDEAREMVEVSSGPGGRASWVMFNPQPEPPGFPGLAIDVSSSGPDLRLFAPQVGGATLANGHPQIRLSSDVGSSRMLLQRAFTSGTLNDSTGFLVHADSIRSYIAAYKGGATDLKLGNTADGGYASFFSDGTEYMGVEPAPWHAGGDLTMYDATGGVTLLLASNGMASIGTGNHTNILTILQGSATDPIADAWTTYSSRRWKTNIQPLQGALDKVMQLNGVSFDWIEGGKHDIGLIAEDVGQVVPEVVAYEENGVDAKSIDYAPLTALLIEAVKEQQKTIDKLKSEIDEVKAQINQ